MFSWPTRKILDSYLYNINNSAKLVPLDIIRVVACFFILFMHIESGFNSYTGNKFVNFLIQ